MKENNGPSSAFHRNRKAVEGSPAEIQSRGDRRKTTGKIGEEAAAEYLIGQSYSIVDRNWRCRSGELDIVATVARTLVFVEVRTRRASGRFGSAAESVDARKQRRVRLLAQIYMQLNRPGYESIRFDAIAVTIGASDKIEEIRHYPGAF